MKNKNRLFIRKTLSYVTKAILLLLTPYLIYSGCIKVSNEEIPITLDVTNKSMDFPPVGAEINFTISSNFEWTVTVLNDAQWLKVNPRNGSDNRTVTVIADPNQNTDSRSTTITVSNGVPNKEQNINATQEATILSVSPTSLSFSSSGEQKSFDITSNISWTVSSNTSSWLTISPTSNSIDRTVTVTASTNTTTSQRTATITVSGNGITRSIAVTQTGFNNYTETTNGLNLEMIAVHGGTFTMGCTSEQGVWGGDCSYWETPTHQVTLSDFYIGKYEVTQGQWRAIVGNNPSYFTRGDNYPVERVSWDDIVGTSGATMRLKNITYYANGFIYKLNQLTGKQYRLPTEAEWEYAARGGWSSKGYKYSGSNTVGNVAWYEDNSDNRTHSVGGKSANELGIYDMSGNVYEWCSDWWFASYNYFAVTDPTVTSYLDSRHVVRGGVWYNNAYFARVSCRDYGDAPDLGYGLGFRLASGSSN